MTTSMEVFHMFTTAPEALNLQQLHIYVWDQQVIQQPVCTLVTVCSAHAFIHSLTNRK